MSVAIEILKKHGSRIVDLLRRSMDEKGLTASGETKRSINYDVIQEQFFDILTISANLALKVLQEGRKPNVRTTGELRPAIERWVETKPINPVGITKNQLVYLIVRKIAREGIKVPNKYNPGNIINDVITEELINRIYREVLQAYANEYIQSIKTLI